MMSDLGRGREGMMGGMRMIEGRGGRGVVSIRVRGRRIMGGLRGGEALSGIAPESSFKLSALFIVVLMHAWLVSPSTFFVRNRYCWVLPDS